MGGALATVVSEGSCIRVIDRSLEKRFKLSCLRIHAVALDHTLVRGLSHAI